MARAKPRRSASRVGLVDQLRDAIRASDRTDHDLAIAAGVAPSALSRFMRGERGLTLDTVDALCEVLGYRLVGATGGRRGRGRAETPTARALMHEPPAPRTGLVDPTDESAAPSREGDAPGPCPVNR